MNYHPNQRGFSVVDVILLIVVLMLGVIVAAPLITSYEVEKVYKSIVENANQHSEDLSIELNSFERGWFESTASYVISGGDTGSFVIKMNDKISHGPFFPGELMSGGNPMLLAKVAGQTELNIDGLSIKDKIGLNEVIKASFVTSIDWQQQCQTNGYVAAIDSRKANSSGDDVVVVMDNVEINMTFDCTKFDGNISAHLPVLYAASAGSVVKLEAIKVDADHKMTPSGLPAGKSAISVGEALFSKDEQAVHASGIAISSEQNIDGETMSVSMQTGVKNIDANGEQWGPGKFSIALNSLNTAAIVELSNTSQDEPDQGMMKLMEVGPRVFSNSPEINIDEISLGTPYGGVNGNGKASLPDVPAADLMNPFILMNSVIANAHLDGPKELVKMLTAKVRQQQMMAQKEAGEFTELSEEEIAQIAADQSAEEMVLYEAMGFVRTDGDKYAVDVDVKNGQLLINGQPLR